MRTVKSPPRWTTGRPPPRRAATEPTGIGDPSTAARSHRLQTCRRACRRSSGRVGALLTWLLTRLETWLLINPAVHVLLAARRVGEQIRDRARLDAHAPDAGMESADKILWAAAITVIVGVVALAMKNMLVAAVNSISLTLGW